MSQGREEILENFMVVSGIKNVEEAIIWLECCDWNLTNAMKVSSPEQADLQKKACWQRIEKGASNGLSSEDQNETLGLRVIQVYLVHGSNVHLVRAPDTITVNCFKRLISFTTNVPPSQQLISGWTQQPTSEDQLISFMPNLSYMNLRDMSLLTDEGADAMELDEESISVYNFKIIDQVHDKTYDLNVPGNQTVAQVKIDAYLLTDIPLDSQLWSGWPDDVTDDADIHSLHLEKPFHLLEIRTKALLSPETSSVQIDGTDEVVNLVPSEIFDLDESDIGLVSSRGGRAPLIPDNIEDETAGSIHFIDGFIARYEQSSPCFFSGSLEDALREASRRPARERKMLALYLHHDGSVLTNVFCTELLGSEAAHQLFTNYFVVWGWDITNDSGRSMLMSAVTKVLGHPFARTVQSIQTDSFPALFIVAPMRSQHEILSVMYGGDGISEFLCNLVSAVEIFTSNMEVEAREEDERLAREKIKYEQDTAYEQSLEMDRRKEAAKRQKLIEESHEEERARNKKALEDKRKLEEIAAVRSGLPKEPAESDQDCLIFTFKFRTPDGQTFERRFSSTDTLAILLDFLFVKGFAIEDFKFFTGWPRKDLSLMDPRENIGNLGIFSKETIILEHR